MKPKTLSTSETDGQKNKSRKETKSSKSDKANRRGVSNGGVRKGSNVANENVTINNSSGKNQKSDRRKETKTKQNESGGIMRYLFSKSSKRNPNTATATTGITEGEHSGEGGVAEREEEWWPVDTLSSRQKRQIEKETAILTPRGPNRSLSPENNVRMPSPASPLGNGHLTPTLSSLDRTSSVCEPIDDELDIEPILAPPPPQFQTDHNHNHHPTMAPRSTALMHCEIQSQAGNQLPLSSLGASLLSSPLHSAGLSSNNNNASATTPMPLPSSGLVARPNTASNGHLFRTGSGSEQPISARILAELLAYQQQQQQQHQSQLGHCSQRTYAQIEHYGAGLEKGLDSPSTGECLLSSGLTIAPAQFLYYSPVDSDHCLAHLQPSQMSLYPPPTSSTHSYVLATASTNYHDSVPPTSVPATLNSASGGLPHLSLNLNQGTTTPLLHCEPTPPPGSALSNISSSHQTDPHHHSSHPSLARSHHSSHHHHHLHCQQLPSAGHPPGTVPYYATLNPGNGRIESGTSAATMNGGIGNHPHYHSQSSHQSSHYGTLNECGTNTPPTEGIYNKHCNNTATNTHSQSQQQQYARIREKQIRELKGYEASSKYQPPYQNNANGNGSDNRGIHSGAPSPAHHFDLESLSSPMRTHLLFEQLGPGTPTSGSQSKRSCSQWRMTLFVFYWIIWIFFLIIIVAANARSS